MEASFDLANLVGHDLLSIKNPRRPEFRYGTCPWQTFRGCYRNFYDTPQMSISKYNLLLRDLHAKYVVKLAILRFA